jgi:hypothetical protein
MVGFTLVVACMHLCSWRHYGSPGRYFAANEMKTMLAHILVTYDVKLENEGVRPPNECFATYILPNQTAKVMFRKRQT